MKTKRYSTSSSSSSSSSSDDKALIVLKQGKENPNGYHSLCSVSWEQCEFCDEVFCNRYDLFQHNITHMVIPLTKQATNQCKSCLRHFKYPRELETHVLKDHHAINASRITINDINLKEKMPDILKSLVEKQVLIKCTDDISVLLKSNLGQNGKSKTRTDYTESQKDERKSDSIHLNLSAETTVNTNRSNEVTNEPESFIEERISSPIDEENEKESLRHRLLFEEDIEDTLFRDISSECNVNIETLCQEVSLEFDEAILVSDSDDSMSPDVDYKTNNLCEMDNTETVINNFHHAINSHETAMNNFQHGINIYEGGMNNFQRDIIEFEETSSENGRHNFEHVTNSRNGFKDGTNVCDDGLDNLGYVINSSLTKLNNLQDVTNNPKDVMNNLKYGYKSNNFETLDLGVNVIGEISKPTMVEGYVKAIHYDDLIMPDNWVCQYCEKGFLNRFELLQHEPVHLKVKKKHWSSPLCAICDRYIVGNYRTLRTHVAQKHPEYADREINFTTHYCPKCGLKYNNYMQHLKNYHEPYRCDKCSRGLETLKSKNSHDCVKSQMESQIAFGKSGQILCGRSDGQTVSYVLMQLCDLCYSFMKIYMQNRQNYEEIGTKTELGVRQTCDKCNKEFFSVKLLKRYVRPGDARRMDGGQKALEVRMASNSFKSDFGQKVPEVAKYRMKPTKPMSNKERLMKIQNRLKMMKMINKC